MIIYIVCVAFMLVFHITAEIPSHSFMIEKCHIHLPSSENCHLQEIKSLQLYAYVVMFSAEGYPDIIFQVTFYGCVQGPFLLKEDIESYTSVRPVFVQVGFVIIKCIGSRGIEN